MKTSEKKENEDHLSANAAETGSSGDRALVISAQGGDMNAFEELIQKYDRHVLSLAFSYTRNSDDAKDIYQETLIRAYRSITKFEMRSEFSTWLYRIAANVCIRFRSTQKRYTEIFGGEPERRQGDGQITSRPDPPSSRTVEGEFFRTELRRQIERALELLSPMQRLVFIMKHYEGYKLREIAAMTDCAEGTVKKHLYEAVRRLQRELESAI